MSKVFFISDLHLGHKSVIKFGKRDYKSLDEMNASSVSEWNSVVTKRDKIFVLGDVAWTNQALKLYSKMNGQKHLIMGNHDNKFLKSELSKYFYKISGVLRYKKCILTHIPIHPSEFHRWRYNIHGHLHGNKIDDPRYINVNVDTIRSFRPLEFTELIKQHELEIACKVN